MNLRKLIVLEGENLEFKSHAVSALRVISNSCKILFFSDVQNLLNPDTFEDLFPNRIIIVSKAHELNFTNQNTISKIIESGKLEKSSTFFVFDHSSLFEMSLSGLDIVLYKHLKNHTLNLDNVGRSVRDVVESMTSFLQKESI